MKSVSNPTFGQNTYFKKLKKHFLEHDLFQTGRSGIHGALYYRQTGRQEIKDHNSCSCHLEIPFYKTAKFEKWQNVEFFDAKTLTNQDRIFLKFCSWPAFFSFKICFENYSKSIWNRISQRIKFFIGCFFFCESIFRTLTLLRENKLVKFWPPNETSESDKKFCKNLGKFEYSRRERRLCKEQW